MTEFTLYDALGGETQYDNLIVGTLNANPMTASPTNLNLSDTNGTTVTITGSSTSGVVDGTNCKAAS